MTRVEARFEVDGVPVPQGSKTAFVVNGKAVMTDANKDSLKPWRALVKSSAERARERTLQGPLVVHIAFVFVRPKTVKREFPSVKPDLDKLVRAVFDGITDARLWQDDAQVVDLHTSKEYGNTPGAVVRIGFKESKLVRAMARIGFKASKGQEL